MFLKATGQRTGAIVGETVDKAMPDQIDIVDWSWAMSAPSAVDGRRAGRVAMGALRIVKRVDRATTAFMSVMNNNEIMPKVVLSVRKAGGTTALSYFVLTLDQARISAYEVCSEPAADGTPVLTEHVSMTFKTITVDYTAQTTTGGASGASSFTGQAGID
jgi:type VI secretion system secreted protein Hcp